MFYNVQKVKDITDTQEKFFTRKVLMEHDNSSLSVVAIKKEKLLTPTHQKVMQPFTLLMVKLNYTSTLKNSKLTKEKFLCSKKIPNIRS